MSFGAFRARRKLAYVHDESFGGLGLYLDEVRGLETGAEVDMVYAGELLRGCVRHIETRDEGGYVVGFECTANLYSEASRHPRAER